MGAEVFDDVAFYYVACSFLVTILVPLSLYLLYSDVSDMLENSRHSKYVKVSLKYAFVFAYCYFSLYLSFSLIFFSSRGVL